MSPEEQQVLFDEWGTIVCTALNNVRCCAQHLKDDNEIADMLDDTSKLLNTMAGDIAKLVWSPPDRHAARTLIAGYVTQSNTERQERRDADLERHKRMVDIAADQRVAEGVSNAQARARNAEARAEAADARAKEIIEQAEKVAKQRLRMMEDLFLERVEAAVQERLMGVSDSATPGRTKRPLIIGD